ncbi:hypothetical protein SB725_32145, partial [Pseudomonas sp. SIMBA_041]|uniref:hypothetical protein n=1 Tax=Pseudomonas sp. SIMBA_041 TaxID=3085782 RepID=UPI00397C722F
ASHPYSDNRRNGARPDDRIDNVREFTHGPRRVACDVLARAGSFTNRCRFLRVAVPILQPTVMLESANA